MSKIGIPRTLAYFIYYPFWHTFFSELGHEVVLSDRTNRNIVDKGVKEAVNDACIPIKIYHGHAADLIGKVDCIFCPRLVSLRKHGDFGTETFCPKFLGLPDMIKLAIHDLPQVIDVRIDLKKGKREIDNVCLEVGQALGNNPTEIKKAQIKAARVQKLYQKLLCQEILPEEAMEIAINNKKAKSSQIQPELTIAVVGYPYTIYDNYINVGLIKLLQKENVRIVTQDMLSNKTMNRQAKTLPKSLFWYFSNRALYGALHYIESQTIDGIIHVTAFACGPDAMVDRLIEIETHKRSNLPYLSLTIDEQTGEAGVGTRIEAFLDMLRYRRSKKSED